MLDEYVKRVDALFGEGSLFCAETVLKLVAEAGGKDASDLIRLATGFCSGASRTCGQCGAVSGAIMGIGLFAGRPEPGGEYEPAYELVQEFITRFKDQYGSINCYELVECDFATPEGQKKFKQLGLKSKCVEFSARAVMLAVELLGDAGYVPSEEELCASQLGPCGLSCGQCLAFNGGPIQELSVGLAEKLGDNFEAYARRFENGEPVFANYPQFRQVLDYLADGACKGCRQGGCLFKACDVPECVAAHNVEYCFQCDEFPCEKHGMPQGLAERWKANNEKMSEVGVHEWLCGCRQRPRYP